jgi:hypothetical protein
LENDRRRPNRWRAGTAAGAGGFARAWHQTRNTRREFKPTKKLMRELGKKALKTEAATNNENRKNENANNIIGKQKAHWPSDSVRLPGADNPASVVGRRLQQLGHQRLANASRS